MPHRGIRVNKKTCQKNIFCATYPGFLEGSRDFTEPHCPFMLGPHFHGGWQPGSALVLLFEAYLGKIDIMEDSEIIKKILKHLNLLDLKSRPPPKRANATPSNIHFTDLVFGFTALILTTCCYLILSKLLINFYARFR